MPKYDPETGEELKFDYSKFKKPVYRLVSAHYLAGDIYADKGSTVGDVAEGADYQWPEGEPPDHSMEPLNPAAQKIHDEQVKNFMPEQYDFNPPDPIQNVRVVDNTDDKKISDNGQIKETQTAGLTQKLKGPTGSEKGPDLNKGMDKVAQTYPEDDSKALDTAPAPQGGPSPALQEAIKESNDKAAASADAKSDSKKK